MYTLAVFSSLLAAALAAPATTIATRQTVAPADQEIAFQVVDFSTALELSNNSGTIGGTKSGVSTLTVNTPSKGWAEISTLVAGLNDMGNVGATGIVILTPLKEGTKCNLYNGDKHVIAEMDAAHTVYDFNWHFDLNSALHKENPRRSANEYKFECVSA
ncbi:hypothetical protein BU24DRAFT_429293 [Aaosphaeria arxii CBS 175.79]|uniref:Uncharacterized protein n=1 Tax=Aaosphaeria arxii CBS 175.79 TaxID=1450172 RepID=A0A6A5X6B7_9PLEO|nr:uncharacterized protein BU24DRAFT_429293 [Aaosphaeria arxii CBS 175.79]KAF2008421.1 hypothetical protein BU24DRAFT_429293 [Aaosphaeria arxii CBS 175.79]